MLSTRLRGRTVIAAACRCAAVCAAAAIIAGCGSRAELSGAGAPNGLRSGSPSVGGPAAHGSGSAGPARDSPAADLAGCPRSGIRVRLDLRSAGVAAGTAFIPLDFTNVSALPCRLAGFPTVTLASRSGGQLGSAGQADSSLSAGSLILAAGQTAHAWLHLTDVINLPVFQCQPVTAAGLRVVLPGWASGAFISDALTTCHKQVHGTDLLIVEPFRPGEARPGTAG